MHKHLALRVSLHLGLLLLPSALAATSAKSLQTTDLRCESLREPIGLQTAVPRFSWQIAQQAGARGLVQKAYQIQVTDAEGELLWDTGTVRSDQSVNVAYAGKPLASNQDARWKVRLWGADDQPGAWSEPQRFVIGLLDQAEWTGPWIRHRVAQDIDHIWYRKSFALEKVPERALLHLASIGYHELYLNGRRVDDRVLAPSVTNLTKRVHYVSYDVQAFLRPGKNVIGVWTGAGWAMADGSYGKGVWEQDSVIRCQFVTSDGLSLASDGSWKCQVSHTKHRGKWKGGGLGEYGGEIIDARLNIPDWNQPDHDDRHWQAATPYTEEGLPMVRADRRNAMLSKLAGIQLHAQQHEPDRKVKRMDPVSMSYDAATDTARYDMGTNFTGWLEFDLRQGKEGQRVLFQTANRGEMVEEFDQVSVYIHDAGGEGTFSHRFNYMAGRWITVRGLGYEPSKQDLRGHLVTNDRPRIGTFECSDPLLQQIYESDLVTYIANTVNGVTMDCPHRERYGYGEVAFACAWGPGILNYESAAYYRKGILDWIDVQRDDGFVNTIAPQVYKGAGGALWSSAPATLSWEYHRAYGDLRQLAKGYASMKKWVDYLHPYVKDEGVLTAYESASRFLGDWATPHGNEYGNTEAAKLFNNCVYAYCLDVVAKSARALGKPREAKVYEDRLAKLRPAIHRKWYNEGTGLYHDGRQLSLAFPLYVKATPEPLREAVLAKLKREIRVNKPYLDTGSSGLPILLKFIVEDLRDPELILHCLQSTEQPSYGYFLKRDQFTWPEYWQVDGIPSRIHTCYTGISGWFLRGVAGIHPDPEQPGMQHFLIEPKLVGDLEWVKARSASLYGPIVSEWSREGKQASLVIEIPPNTSARVIIPTVDPNTVTESDVQAGAAKGVKLLEERTGEVVYQLGSGRYLFRSRIEK